MFTPIYDQGSVILFAAIAVLFCIQVGKNIHRSGIEHYGSRILLLSAIIDISLVSILLLFVGILGLREIFTASNFSLITLIIILSLFVLPIRSIWNYVSIPIRIKNHFHLKPDKTKEFQVEVSTLTGIMGISDPIILSSPLIRTPFVYGYGSKATFLAVPANWHTIDNNNRRIMLIHELAHIRHRDVGFLSWSFAFLRDLKWMLVIIPIITALSLTTTYEYLFGISLLYFMCLFILWLVTKSVIRKRELLADLTVAMLVGSSEIEKAYGRLQSIPATGLQSTQIEAFSFIHRIRNWLSDKALFSKKTKFWKPIKQLFDGIYINHPSIWNRLRIIKNRHIESIRFSIQLNESFWTGITLGLLGVFIALGGFWYGKFFLKLQDDIEISSLSYRCFGSVAPLAAGFVALLFVLPGWSSIKAAIPTRKTFTSLLSRYLMGLIGASLVSLLILVGGWSHIEIKLLLVLDIAWMVLILLSGFGVNIVMMVSWLPLRYKQSHFFTDLFGAIYSFGLGIAVILVWLTLGLMFFFSGKIFIGANIILGLLIGLSIYSVMLKDSRVSGTEQYLVIAYGPFVLRLEGRKYRFWSPLIGSAHILILSCIPAVIACTIIHLLTYTMGKNIGDLMAIFILVMTGCALLVILGRRWPKKINESMRRKIYQLNESLSLLGQKIFSIPKEYINKELHTNNKNSHGNKRSNFGIMTTQKMFELTMLALWSEEFKPKALEQAKSWILTCETKGGFGPWPGSTARLCSTYQCLKLLEYAEVLPIQSAHRHIAWIKDLYQASGFFREPLSRRRIWEDTFFAIASLSLLGSNFQNRSYQDCLKWAYQILKFEGIQKDRLDACLYSLEIINILDKLDIQDAELVSKWISSKIDGLLLTNISHNFEKVYHAIRIHHILDKQGKYSIESEQISLLSERINIALEAELSTLQI